MRIFTASIVIFLLITPSYALELSYENGLKNTINEDFEDDLTYIYDQYDFSLEQKLTKTNTYCLSYSQTKKYYPQSNFDNDYHQIKNKYEYLFDKNNIKKQFTLKLDYKTKEYNETPANNYSRLLGDIKFAYRDKNSHLLRFAGGYNNFRHKTNTNNNEDIFEAKVEAEKYFDNFTLEGASKIVNKNPKNSSVKTETTNKIGIAYGDTNISCAFGFRNSFDDSDFDMDLDYRFKQFNLYAKKDFGEKLTGVLKYETSDKEYLTSNYSSSGFEAENNWRYDFLKTFFGKLNLNYRQRLYDTVTTLTHYKNGYEVSLNVSKQRDLGGEILYRETYYRFPRIPSRGRVNKTIELALNKYLSKTTILILSWKYQIDDFKNSPDIQHNSWQIGAAL